MVHNHFVKRPWDYTDRWTRQMRKYLCHTKDKNPEINVDEANELFDWILDNFGGPITPARMKCPLSRLKRPMQRDILVSLYPYTERKVELAYDKDDIPEFDHDVLFERCYITLPYREYIPRNSRRLIKYSYSKTEVQNELLIAEFNRKFRNQENHVYAIFLLDDAPYTPPPGGWKIMHA